MVAPDASTIVSSSIIISLPSFVIHGPSFPIRLISNVGTQYTYTSSADLQSVATNVDHDIFFLVSISKPFIEGVSSFPVTCTNTTSLFTSVTVIHNTLQSSITNTTKVTDGLTQ